MLIAECGRLSSGEIDPKYHAETWKSALSMYESEWFTFATKTGPDAAKQLYWGAHSMRCEDTEVEVGGNALERHFDFYFGCEDFEGKLFRLRRKFPPGYFQYMYFKASGPRKHVCGHVTMPVVSAGYTMRLERVLEEGRTDRQTLL